LTKYKLGIIGAGYWATNIINTLEEMNVKSVHVYDISYDKLLKIKKNFKHIIIYNDINNFFSKIQNVIIVTPPSTHYQLTKKCFSKNLNVFLEKPATLNSVHLRKLHRISKKINKIFMVGYIYNFNVYINYIKKILIKKKLGKIKYISFQRLNLGPVRNDNSCFWDLSSHDLSTLIYLTNEKPKVDLVNGYSFLKKNIYDIGTIFLTYRDVKVEIKSSWLNPEKIRKIIIVGEKKMLLFNEMNLQNPITIYDQYASYPKVHKFNKSFFTPTANIYYGKTYNPKIKFKAPLRSELLYFLKITSSKSDGISKNIKNNSLHALQIHSLLEEVDKKLS
jgi:predicted dehydrogenase